MLAMLVKDKTYRMNKISLKRLVINVEMIHPPKMAFWNLLNIPTYSRRSIQNLSSN